MTEVISFYGTDGSGKSTIAKRFSDLNDTNDSVMLGGSSYKSWLTPEVARLTLGKNHNIGETLQSVDDELRLYEDIAIACYGFARVLANRGSEVVIDSDPYFKRIIWGTIDLDAIAAANYIEHFENKMIDILGETEGPDVIVGVNMGDSVGTSREELFARLASRETNTEHDPTEIEALIALDERVNFIWDDIRLARHGLSTVRGFNDRINKSRVFTIENPNCQPEDIAMQSLAIARTVRSRL